MFVIKIAEITIAIENKYEFVKTFCRKYIVSSDSYDFKVNATQEEIDKERLALDSTASDGFIESICIYRNIANELPKYDAFVIHCAAIEYEGNAYCFTAKSGVGKTTHIKLWRSTIGENVHIINGDKPIIRLINSVPYVFGTPWSGKENYNDNVCYPLKSVCFLSRGVNNSIVPITNLEALNIILGQVYIQKNSNMASKTLGLLGKVLETAFLWKMSCNISKDAALLAFNTMTKED